MRKSFVRSLFAGGLGLCVMGLGISAGAAPTPSPLPRTDTTNPSAQAPSRTPGDPNPATGQGTGTAPVPTPRGDIGTRPGTDIGRTGTEPSRTATPPSDPNAPSGIMNEKDIPGHASAVSPKEARATEKAIKDLHNINSLEIALGSLAREKTSSDAIKEYAKMLVESHQTSDQKLSDYASVHGFTLSMSPPVATGDTAGKATTPSTDRLGASGNVNSPSAAGTRTGTSPSNPNTVAGTTPSPSTTGTPSERAAATGTATGTGSGSPGIATERAPSTTASDATKNPGNELDAEGRRTYAKLEKLDGEKFDKQFLTTMVQGHTKALAKVKTFEKQLKSADLATLLTDARSMIENHLQRAKELQRGASASLPGNERTLGTIRP